MIVVIIATLWVTICSACDLVTRRVPNMLLALGILGAALLRAGSLLVGSAQRDAPALVLSAAVVLSVWTLGVAFWLVRWWGAADAKFIMALSLAFPDLGLLLAIAIANALAGLVGLGINHPEGKRLPAVAILAFGWLVWAVLFIARGYS